MTFGNYPFLKAVGYSLFITLASTALILVCTSMAAWYVSRVGELLQQDRILSLRVLHGRPVPDGHVHALPHGEHSSSLDTPWTIPVIYLGFGAGLAVFMFCGFVKSIPLEIEEAAAIDGCGPVRTFFSGGPADAEADDHLRRRAGDHVGVERLSFCRISCSTARSI